MPEQSRIASTRRLARVSLLAALALVLSYIETMIPLPVALPGVKLGLSNVAVVVALLSLDVRAGVSVALAKVVASGFLFGSPMMFAYSLGGTVLAFSGAAALSRVPDVGAVAVSMVAAVLHNAGQLAVAALLLGTASVFVNLPPLALAACVTGAVTGAVASGVLAAQPGGRAGEVGAAGEGVAANAGGAAAVVADEGGEAGANGAASTLVRGTFHVKRSATEVVSPDGAHKLVGGSSSSSASNMFSRPATAGGFGVYRPGSSLAHRLDPRAKIVFVVLFFVAAFCAQGLVGLAALAFAAVVSQAASGGAFARALRQLKPFVWLMVFVTVFDALFVRSGAVLLEAGPLCVSAGGIAFGVENVVRFACLLLGTSALMATTSPAALTDGFALLARPLSRAGVRTDRAQLAVSMTFRFVPTLVAEFDRIRIAQASRAASFGGNVAQRAISTVPVLVPLFTSALRRSETLAFAVESRLFGANPGGRTRLKTYRMGGCDWAAIAAGCMLVALVIIL